MGNSALTLDHDEVTTLSEATGFTANQVAMLFQRFQALDKRRIGKITKEDFLAIPELHINPLVDRILSLFDEGGTDEVNFNQFVQVLSVFRSVYDVEAFVGGDEAETENQIEKLRTEKMRFVFRIYDIKADGYIDKDELLEVIQMMVGTHVGKADLDAVVAQTFKEADSDLDGKLSFKEFRHVIEHTDIGQRLSIGF